MNLLNKISMALVAMVMLFSSCESLIFDDLGGCPRGVYASFFSESSSDSDASCVGQVTSLVVFAFDESDRLVSVVEKGDVVLSENYDVFIPSCNSKFTFIARAGVNDNLNISSLRTGRSKKNDVLNALKYATDEAENIDDVTLWHGLNTGTAYMPKNSQCVSGFEHVKIKLHELAER